MTTEAFDTVAEAKRLLRAEARARRSTANAAAPDAGARAADQFLDAITPTPNCVVSGYWPMGDEFDVRPLLEMLDARGHPIGLPVVVGNGQPLVFRRWRPGDRLEPAVFGTSVPGKHADEVTPSLLLVPLLAVDPRGFRLGYGGGFYDRSLDGLRAAGDPVTAVGVGFDAQCFASVPTNDNDQPLDWLVTEHRAVAFA
jgi:5-formyltetrahydrofolate cyclo-ligase